MDFESKEGEKLTYSAQKEKLITQSHLETLASTDIEKEIIALRDRIDSNKNDLENKKQELLNAVTNQASPEDIKILVIELMMKYQNLNDLEIQFTARLTIKKSEHEKLE